MTTTAPRDRVACDPYGDAVILFASPPHKVGKHEWRFLVYETARPMYGRRRFTSWEWRRLPMAGWSPETWKAPRAWPSYDGNDTYDGLPRTLCRIFRLYQDRVREILTADPECPGKDPYR